jgi:hypothetical protein
MSCRVFVLVCFRCCVDEHYPARIRLRVLNSLVFFALMHRRCDRIDRASGVPNGARACCAASSGDDGVAAARPFGLLIDRIA